MNTCKTCMHWKDPQSDDIYAEGLCSPLDPEAGFQPMERGFASKVCKLPTQTFGEAPVERNGFALVDGSRFYAVLVTAEDFGCLRHVLIAEPRSARLSGPQRPAQEVDYGTE